MMSSDSLSDTARTWLGTAFAHQGRRKASDTDKGGVDCLGLLVKVADECGVVFGNMCAAHLDQTDYGHYPDERRLFRALSLYLTPCETIQKDAVLLMRIDGRNQHLGIVGERAGRLTLIHAYAPARKVVEHGLDDAWKNKIIKCFILSSN